MLRTACLVSLISAATAQGWVDRTPTTPLTGPSNRAFAAMCWDAAHGYVLMYGGATPNGLGASNETWSWDGANWTRRLTSSPGNTGWNAAAPVATTMVFDPPTNAVLMVTEGSTWRWNGSDWVNLPVAIGNNGNGSPKNVALGRDSASNQTILFVGARFSSGTPYYASETHLWNGFGWTQIFTPVMPWPLEYPSMAFDPVAQRLVLSTSGGGQSAYFEWTGSSWQQRLPAGAPAAAGAMATDTVQNQIVMLDGVLTNTPQHTWRLTNGTLTPIATAIEPARRFGAAMAFDPVRQRIVLFGGTNAWNYNSNLLFTLGDTWEFQLGAGASYTTYGTGCAGSRGVPSLAAQNGSLPRVGQTVQLNVGNLPFTGPVFLFLGLSDTSYGPTPLPYSLAGLGAPGCSILCSGEAPYLVTNVLGSALWQWTVPNAPGVTFFNQAFAFDPAANVLGITASNAGRGTIGF